MINITRLIDDGNIDEAIDRLNLLIADNPSDDTLFFIRGKAYWKKGNRPAARNDFARAVAINQDSPAAIAITHADDIEQFFNPDLLNP